MRAYTTNLIQGSALADMVLDMCMDGLGFRV